MNDFYIACMDEQVYRSLILKGYNGAFLFMNSNLKEYQNWTFDSNSGFRNIVRHKWEIINQVHKEHPNLMWIDTDIVFKENPLEILTGHEEVLFQTDSPGHKICTGFMVFNETPKCRQLIEECGADNSNDDQIIMNRIGFRKYNDIIVLLSNDLFPNGHAYYYQGKKENAMIVHNNWILGIEAKINKFKEEGLWFI
ncbi:MAG: glycosyltransferase family 77 protein [Lentisphaeria bacterium]|nr:glycosyltransferase family 77 protein [Lentisphaeria bacterium]